MCQGGEFRGNNNRKTVGPWLAPLRRWGKEKELGRDNKKEQTVEQKIEGEKKIKKDIPANYFSMFQDLKIQFKNINYKIRKGLGI